MKVIYKYAFDPDSPDDELEVPHGKVLHVAAQRASDPLPTVWVEHDSAELGDAYGRIHLQFHATGHRFDQGLWQFVGTAVCADGSLVWHVYRTPAA